MKIAIPTSNGEISAHFGHCEAFEVFTIEDKKIVGRESLQPPAHEPGSHPRFLHEHGVKVVLAGGMGSRAQNLMQQNDIKSIVGIGPKPLEEIVNLYLQDELEAGDNSCDH